MIRARVRLAQRSQSLRPIAQLEIAVQVAMSRFRNAIGGTTLRSRTAPSVPRPHRCAPPPRCCGQPQGGSCARRCLPENGRVELHTHVLAGHPVRNVIELAIELDAELLVIGATGHSAFYERMVGSRADRIIQLAKCPVLVVK